MISYDPSAPVTPAFVQQTMDFPSGNDSPRAFLERCLKVIEAREPDVQAFAALNIDGARNAADHSTARWQHGAPLSPIDGMPIGIKDLLETKDMPTEMNCAGLAGNFPKRDNATVWALREAGAVIVGKTVTAELGGTEPGPTRNPFDTTRTPGGSSSGSAAAVGAGMLPAAIGTQVGGSIIRPASYCGNYALKPSQGAIHRGERQATSQSTFGPHAGNIEDMWRVAIEIVRRVGGDPGEHSLQGPDDPPDAVKPASLIVLQTSGWEDLDDATLTALDTLFGQLRDAGVTLITRRDAPLVADLEEAIADADRISNTITAWENRWFYRGLMDANRNALSARAQKTLARAEAMSPADYQDALAQRAEAQACHAAIRPLADAILTASSPGPAPVSPPEDHPHPSLVRPTGDAVFNYPSSMLFAPAVTVPKLSVGGLPVGVQINGQPGEDAHVTALARWLSESVAPVVV